jgi:hypothetical protein
MIADRQSWKSVKGKFWDDASRQLKSARLALARVAEVLKLKFDVKNGIATEVGEF